ncbi:MAG TPA: PDZ domain-containing protein [Candidatus Sulfopaludibacter sp.]|nr:PDZ domain-containing protein [Candidatus Sulfopaludibacter sp.]
MTRVRVIGIAALVWASAMPAAFAQAAGAGSGQGRARSAGVLMKDASYLGIGVEDVDSDRARNLKLKEESGAYVTSVMPDTPAFKAGLKEGDVILEYNGQRVDGREHLIRLVRDTAPGKQVKIGLWRAGAPLTVMATVASHKVMESEDGNWSFNMPSLSMPNLPELPHGFAMPSIDIPKMITVMQNSTLGIEGESLAQQPQLAEFFGVKDGVLVKSVAKGSAAERAGMKAGDVLVRIGDTKVATSRDVAGALRYAQAGRSVNVAVVRNKKEMPLTVTIDERR